MRQMPGDWIASDPTLLVVESAQDGATPIRVAARKHCTVIDVRVAGDGREGIAYLSGTPPFHHRWAHPLPNLVILDIDMPGRDGFDLLEWVRDNRGLARMPVVVLTGSADPEDEQRVRSLDVAGFYRKPPSRHALCELLDRIVSQWIPRDPGEARRRGRAC